MTHHLVWPDTSDAQGRNTALTIGRIGALAAGAAALLAWLAITATARHPMDARSEFIWMFSTVATAILLAFAALAYRGLGRGSALFVYAVLAAVAVDLASGVIDRMLPWPKASVELLLAWSLIQGIRGDRAKPARSPA